MALHISFLPHLLYSSSKQSFPQRALHSSLYLHCSSVKQDSQRTAQRRSANYQPTSWTSDFVKSLTNYNSDEIHKQRAKKLKEEVRAMIGDEDVNPSTILELIDDIQRLGLSYHFEEDIRRALNRIMFVQGTNVRLEKGVHATALYFRLCRQHGFEVSQDVRQPPKDFRQTYFLRPDIKKLLDLPLQQRKAPQLLNFIPTYTSKLADVPRQRKKSASTSTASVELAASTSEPADQPSTSAPNLVPVQEKKRQRKLVKTAEMEKPKKKVLNLLADLPDDMDDAPSQQVPPPKQKRVKKAQPKAKVTEADAEAEDALPIAQLAEKTTSAPAKRSAGTQPSGSIPAKKQKSTSGTTSGSKVPKIPWEPKISLEDRPVYANESTEDINVGVALSTAVLIEGDLERNAQVSEYENYCLMLQRSVQAIQHAHSFSVKSFKTREELSELKKEFAALQKTQKRDQLKMKKLEEQAEEATKAQSIALQKAEAAVNVKKVAEAEKKEAEAKKAEAERELRDALATKKAEIDAAYNQGMEDVAEDYKLQVKQACNKGFVLGWNAMAKQLDLPADSPWRKTKAMRLPCPLPQSQDESESEADAEDEDETLVRKTKSPPKIDLTGDEEVEAAPKKADSGTLSSDLLLVGRSVEETLAEIDAEVAADKEAEVTPDKEAEVVVQEGAEVVNQKDAEEVLPESSEVPIQPSAQVEEV